MNKLERDVRAVNAGLTIACRVRDLEHLLTVVTGHAELEYVVKRELGAAKASVIGAMESELEAAISVN
ncbi:hypothetical protein ACFVAJ_16770 [Agromyces sp. NPDC057679]|uniref:hypothetical protein n=1 Tax=Agromyces sp. NPDC057679 TaxID=3346207 RepID=UPI00366F21AB